jgi:hypothetical protein
VFLFLQESVLGPLSFGDVVDHREEDAALRQRNRRRVDLYEALLAAGEPVGEDEGVALLSERPGPFLGDPGSRERVVVRIDWASISP